MMHAEQAEKTILGLMLLESRAIRDAEQLDAGDFYFDSHREIVSVLRAMHEQGLRVDTVTTVAELGRRKRLDAVGGAGYIRDLTDGIPRGYGLHSYVRLVREKAALRRVVALCELATARAVAGEASDEILHDMQSTALTYQAAGAQVRPTHIAECILPAWEEIKREMEFAGEVLGIPTGIPDVDRCTTGWRDGELTYLGAPPGSGKTSFLLQCMFHAAKAGFGVGCISLEMRADKLIRRLAVMQSGLHAGTFRDPRTMRMTDHAHAKSSIFALADLPIWIADHSGLKPAQIASLARQMHANGAQVIFVDFVQIIHEDGRDRREAINRVSASLRDTCKGLNIPFVVASQLARGDKDVNRRPTKADLRESGNLEQDAHNVLLLYRPKDRSTGDWTGEDEIIIDKQREGVTGIVPVVFDTRSVSFKGRQA